MSPSSRRAWIEIQLTNTAACIRHPAVALLAEGVDRNSAMTNPPFRYCVVALLAEGVDRNLLSLTFDAADEKSPSSRRAWIEIAVHNDVQIFHDCRPPRGGRG